MLIAGREEPRSWFDDRRSFTGWGQRANRFCARHGRRPEGGLGFNERRLVDPRLVDPRLVDPRVVGRRLVVDGLIKELIFFRRRDKGRRARGGRNVDRWLEQRRRLYRLFDRGRGD